MSLKDLLPFLSASQHRKVLQIQPIFISFVFHLFFPLGTPRDLYKIRSLESLMLNENLDNSGYIGKKQVGFF